MHHGAVTTICGRDQRESNPRHPLSLPSQLRLSVNFQCRDLQSQRLPLHAGIQEVAHVEFNSEDLQK